MKLLTYRDQAGLHVGMLSVDEHSVCPLKDYPDMLSLIRSGPTAHAQLTQRAGAPVPLTTVTLCAPIPQPAQDVLCLGVNFAAHAAEADRFQMTSASNEPAYAVYFSKRVNEATAHGGVIPNHSTLVDSLDYEVELAVILGKDAKNVPLAQAFDFVFGYTILNDVSARNIQTRHKQWYFGKSLDGFCPMGPWIVTADEIPAPPVLRIQSRVNGEARQDSSTDQLIFDVAHVIHELSQGMTLQAGTILSMGTPAGVGMGFDPPRFLKPGDRVDCEIEGIGVLSSTISM